MPINFTAFGEVLARRENRVELDPAVKDGWGIPVLRFDYRFGDNELKMAKDMADTAGEMLEAAGAEDIRVRRDVLTEGWSIHELGTARMGNDPKTSVTNSFGQTHDVKQPLRRRRQHFRVGLVPEPDVDDSRAGVARDGLSQGADEERNRLSRVGSSTGRSRRSGRKNVSLDSLNSL